MKVKPILKWVGGKREIIPNLQSFYNNLEFNTYHEPFFGGGSVYIDILTKRNCNSHISDLNQDLINLYKDIKNNPNKLFETIEELKEVYFNKGYYHLRSGFNGINQDKEVVDKYDGLQRSSCLVILNKTCFNGLYRVNKRGLFNVPKGDYKNPKFIEFENLNNLSLILPPTENIHFEDFKEIEFRVENGDFVYFDPPYYPLNETSSFTQYSSSFGKKEQIELFELFKRLDNKGVFVLLSNSSSNFILDLYEEFSPQFILCSRNINSKGNKRGKIKEVVVIGNTLNEYLKTTKLNGVLTNQLNLQP